GDAGRTGGGDGAVFLAEGGAQRRYLGHVGTAWLLVGIDLHIALAAADRDRHDLAGKSAAGLGRLGPVDRFDRVGILVFAAEVVLVGTRFREHAHRLAVVGIGQAVPRHVVDQLAVAIADAGARVDHVRGVGHRLHAAGHHHAGRTGLDQVVAEHDRLHARAAHLVDGG